MKLQDLNSILHSNLKSSNIIKNNVSSDILILEQKNIGKSGMLQSVKIKNSPIDNCWLFDHEDSEVELRAEGQKVEKTVLVLSEEKKELLVLLIEMKSGFKVG